MITEWGRRTFKVVLEPIASIFRFFHITPNVVTLLGFLLNVVAAWLIVKDHIFWGGIVFLVAAGADAVDGTLARQMGIRNKFGAFWDSTIDRLSESIIIMALAYRFVMAGEVMAVMIAFLALITSYLVSYARARGEGIGVDVKVGIGTRVERFIIMAAALILGGFYPKTLLIGLVLIALLAGITVFQRTWVVYQETHNLQP